MAAKRGGRGGAAPLRDAKTDEMSPSFRRSFGEAAAAAVASVRVLRRGRVRREEARRRVQSMV